MSSAVSDDDLIAAIREHGSNAKAADALGLDRRGVDRRMRRMALKGYSPQHDMTRTVPDGFTVKGVSTMYREDGTIAAQWVKSAQDPERVRAIIEAVMAGLRDEVPRVKPTKAPKQAPNDLLNLYAITDYHLGMLAWGEETGADWDTNIAEDMLVAWFAQSLAESPDAEVGVFGQIGDFLHWDGWDAVTPASKHLLDADTRFPRLVRVAIRAVRRIIDMMLAKHVRVHVIMAEGNHDPAASVWLRELCAAMYEAEPRVTVDTSPDPYYGYEWGKNLLLFHHGHKRKPSNIDTVFVSKFREEFGRTQYVYAHMGHMHHVDQKETNLMVVEQHRTLAAPDAYAARGGWMSGRDAQWIVYDKRYGERIRGKVPAQLIADGMAA